MVKSVVRWSKFGETACFVCKNISLEFILRAEEFMERPFLDFAKIGTSISLIDAAVLEQSGDIAFSVEFDDDTGKVHCYDDNGYMLLSKSRREVIW